MHLSCQCLSTFFSLHIVLKFSQKNTPCSSVFHIFLGQIGRGDAGCQNCPGGPSGPSGPGGQGCLGGQGDQVCQCIWFTYFNSRTEKLAGGGGGDGYLRPDQFLDHLTVGLVGKGCNNLLPIRGIQHVNILTFSLCVF